MILRRFTKHVTDQNWFAVGLDVIVVIVGIFVGLQVEGWNEDRKGRILANSLIPEMIAETNNNKEILEYIISHEERIIKGLYVVLQAIEADRQIQGSETEDVAYGLTFSNTLETMPLRTNTLIEMRDLGVFRYIDNPSLRNLLIVNDLFINKAFEDNDSLVKMLPPTYPLEIVTYGRNADNTATRVIDFSIKKAKGNKEFHRDILFAIQANQDWLEQYKDALQLTNAVLEGLNDPKDFEIKESDF